VSRTTPLQINGPIFQRDSYTAAQPIISATKYQFSYDWGSRSTVSIFFRHPIGQAAADRPDSCWDSHIFMAFERWCLCLL
jgi:hypothetical protein